MTLLPKNKRFQDPKYLASFKDRGCLIGDEKCRGDVVAAHFRKGWLAKGMKPHDYLALPLCDYHHRLQHDLGERRFWYPIVLNDDVLFGKIMRMAAEFMYREWTDGFIDPGEK